MSHRKQICMCLVAIGITSVSITQSTISGIAQAAPARKPASKAAPANTGRTTSADSAQHNAYLARLRSKLLNNWMVPDGRNHVELTATVMPDGSVEGVQVTSTPKADQAEVNASDSFSKAQPLEGLPAGLQSARVTIVFISNADPHGDSSSNITTKLEPLKVETKQATPNK